jgi:predicted lysophospholipase L1 biosynthesis ABC-type transport system permease subunit
VPVVAGRDFQDSDWISTSPLRIIISRRLAVRLFGERSAVGQSVRVGLRDLEVAEVIGVIGDVRMSDPRSEPDALVALSYAPVYLRSDITALVRLEDMDPAMHAGLGEALGASVPGLPLPVFRPLSERVDRVMSDQRVLARLLGLLSVLATLVTAVGLYGVLAFAVASRQREFGVRLALGAAPRAVAMLAIGSAWEIVLAGSVLGLTIAYGLSRLMASRLVGVGPLDVPSYLAATGLLLVVALAAAISPARSAARVDPVAALRSD